MASNDEKKRPKKRARTEDESELVLSLRRLDPVLQFLARATAKPTIPLSTLTATLPPGGGNASLQHVPELVRRGVLHLVHEDGTVATDLSNPKVQIGFPPPPSLSDSVEKAQLKKTVGTLHGCTKTAAKRRLTALKQSIKKDSLPSDEQSLKDQQNDTQSATTLHEESPDVPPQKEWAPMQGESDECPDEEVLEEERSARQALEMLFKFDPKQVKEKKLFVSQVLKNQASYAGSNPGRSSAYGSLSEESKIPPALMDAFELERDGACGRRLYRHQAAAINSAMRGIHTLVCTGTGSGKSLCFLLPVLAAAMGSEEHTSMLMFPTKALAQDQMSKLEALVRANPELQLHVRPGVIDGDTPHANRSEIAKSCNVLLTNPDTLHAAILPGWKKTYRPLLERVKYIVIDEAHMYEGVFGAHVAMVLSRLMRLCAVASSTCNKTERLTPVLPTFVACSATMSHPEHHFRLLCPIARDAAVTVLSADDDGSPRSAKHFFVWNPPIMDINGMSTGHVTIARSQKQTASTASNSMGGGSSPQKVQEGQNTIVDSLCEDGISLVSESLSTTVGPSHAQHGTQFFRRHAADETALLLAKAVACGVRCIAFCKTRSLVEWVYERTVSALRSDPATEQSASRVESYRGGYTAEARRLIEQRLFKNELLGVVGTSALELGVDIGGIDITLHCGYPSSYSSLLQQAGRAGRGSARLDVPSLAIMVCFNSPSEQHIWRHAKNLLSRGVSAPTSVPVNVGLVEGHMLCAGEEYPLTGRFPVTALLSGPDDTSHEQQILSDVDLFGSEDVYNEAREALTSIGSLAEEIIPVASDTYKELAVYTTHPSIHRPWTRVSLRSIEPINYQIVDASHVLQGGNMDYVRNEKAVLDIIPYSRVFYHAFPGAIIMHRGQKFKVLSMTRPPAFASSFNGYRGTSNLAAFAKPTNVRYSTRPLSTMKITIIKQMERIDCLTSATDGSKPSSHPERVPPLPQDPWESTDGSLAGNGAVTVKRSVHGYKKLSPITRAEMSRAEISMPPMEFDTYALWVDTEASTLAGVVPDYDAGVHALSHALLAVAPLFVPCSTSDLDCDHKHFGCSRVMLFDVRAGGAGTTSQLWKFLFMPDGLLEAAIDLLENCPSCSSQSDYQGGCPACLHASQCLKFNEGISRSAGTIIAKRMLDRIKQTPFYKKNCETGQSHGQVLENALASPSEHETRKAGSSSFSSPRRKARAKALRSAKHLKGARERQIVVGRTSWPLDEGGIHRTQGQQEKAE